MPQPKNTKFTLRYDGDLYDNHSIDATDLANAIAGFSETLKEADKLINGESSDLQINVVAFKDGCFGTVFEVLQNVAVSPKDVLQIMGFVTGGVAASAATAGVIDYVKELRNKTIRGVDIRGSKATIKLKDDETIEVDPDTAKILTSKVVRDGLSNVFFEPLKRSGATSVTLGTPGKGNAANIKSIHTFSQEEAQLFKAPSRVTSSEKTIWEEDKEVKFTHIHLTGANGWAMELPDGEEVGVKMRDEAFLHRCQQNEQKFSREDTFVVKLKVTRSILPQGGTRLSYEVLRVIRHRADAGRKFL